MTRLNHTSPQGAIANDHATMGSAYVGICIICDILLAIPIILSAVALHKLDHLSEGTCIAQKDPGMVVRMGSYGCTTLHDNVYFAEYETTCLDESYLSQVEIDTILEGNVYYDTSKSQPQLIFGNNNQTKYTKSVETFTVYYRNDIHPCWLMMEKPDETKRNTFMSSFNSHTRVNHYKVDEKIRAYSTLQSRTSWITCIIFSCVLFFPGVWLIIGCMMFSK